MEQSETPTWRIALKDGGHPLHQAAWMLFKQGFNIKLADRLLKADKDIIIPFMYEILDEPELLNEDSLGEGHAPINSVRLIGHWQVTEAIPRLLHILDNTEWEWVVHDSAIIALENLGEPVFDPLIEYGDKQEDLDKKITVVAILGKAAKGTSRSEVFDWIMPVLWQAEDRWDLDILIDSILSIDRERALEVLAKLQREKVYPQVIRDMIKDRIDNPTDTDDAK